VYKRSDPGAQNGNSGEYACHEGNYGLENILRGSRVEEKTAADTGGN